MWPPLKVKGLVACCMPLFGLFDLFSYITWLLNVDGYTIYDEAGVRDDL